MQAANNAARRWLDSSVPAARSNDGAGDGLALGVVIERSCARPLRKGNADPAGLMLIVHGSGTASALWVRLRRGGAELQSRRRATAYDPAGADPPDPAAGN